MKKSATDEMTAIVLLGGDAISPTSVGDLPDNAVVIAADSGVHVAHQLGLSVDVVIGDLDSVNQTALAALVALGTTVIRHPADKNESDAELALRHAAAIGVSRIILVGGGGGRLDHQLSTYAVMFLAALSDIQLEARIAASRAYPIRTGETLNITCPPNSVVGLIPFGGDAQDITTHGLQWPLTDETLHIAASRGISNRSVGTDFSVMLGTGQLIVTVDAPIHDAISR